MTDKEIVKILIEELKDQKDFLTVLYGQFEAYIKMRLPAEENQPSPTEFELAFHLGDTYRLFTQFKEDTNRLSLEIADYLAGKTFDLPDGKEEGDGVI